MTDSYLDFANSPIGARLAQTLGLPKPLKLERYTAGQPVISVSTLRNCIAASEGMQMCRQLKY